MSLNNVAIIYKNLPVSALKYLLLCHGRDDHLTWVKLLTIYDTKESKWVLVQSTKCEEHLVLCSIKCSKAGLSLTL